MGSVTVTVGDLKMEYDSTTKRYLVNNKRFSTIFTKKGKATNDRYLTALDTLGLRGKVNKVNYTSVEDNIAKLRKCRNALRPRTAQMSKLLSGPYQGSVLVDVPPKGDCWLIAILAPLLGFIVESDQDTSKIIPLVRKRMSELVLTEPQKYLHIFGDNKQELEAWAKKIKKWSPKSSKEKWGGVTELQIFAQMTGICVHVINKETYDVEPPVQHILPRTFPRVNWQQEDWTVSVVVVFGEDHYQVLVPPTLQNDVKISEGTTDYKGLEDLIEINSDGEEGDFVPKKGNINKYFPRIKRPTQRKLKEEKKAKKKSVTLDEFLNVSKKGKVQYLSGNNSELSDPDDPVVPESLLKDTESKNKDKEEDTESKNKDKEEDTESENKDKEEDTQSMLNGSDDDKYKEKDTDKDYKEDSEIDSGDDKDIEKD